MDGLAGVAEPGQIVQGQPGEGGLVGAAVLVGTGVLVGAGVLVEVGRGVAVGADEVRLSLPTMPHSDWFNLIQFRFAIPYLGNPSCQTDKIRP